MLRTAQLTALVLGRSGAFLRESVPFTLVRACGIHSAGGSLPPSKTAAGQRQSAAPGTCCGAVFLHSTETPLMLDVPQQHHTPSLLLGTHALLPETARALAELHGARNPSSPVALPTLDDDPLGVISEPDNELQQEEPGVMHCHTKRTFQPSLLIRKRRHGFLSRLRTKSGKRVIARRKAKGRWKITA